MKALILSSGMWSRAIAPTHGFAKYYVGGIFAGAWLGMALSFEKDM